MILGGKKIGLYRYHELLFRELIELVIATENQKNFYGAISIFKEEYSEDLLKEISHMLEQKEQDKYMKFYQALHLEKPINRSIKIGQDQKKIDSDYKKWILISKRYKALLKQMHLMNQG